MLMPIHDDRPRSLAAALALLAMSQSPDQARRAAAITAEILLGLVAEIHGEIDATDRHIEQVTGRLRDRLDAVEGRPAWSPVPSDN